MGIDKKIKELRQKSGLSQEEFANEIGVSRQSVSKWESGVNIPDLDNIGRICKLFGVSSDVILGLEEVAEEKKEETLEMATETVEIKTEGFWQRNWKMIVCFLSGVIVVLLCVLIFAVLQNGGDSDNGDVLGGYVSVQETQAPQETVPEVVIIEGDDDFEILYIPSFLFSDSGVEIPSELFDCSYQAGEYASIANTSGVNVKASLSTFADCIAYFDSLGNSFSSAVFYMDSIKTDGVELGYNARISTQELISEVAYEGQIGFNVVSVMASYYLADDFEDSGYLVVFFDEAEDGEYAVANYFYIDGVYHILVIEDTVSFAFGKLAEKSYTYYSVQSLDDFEALYSGQTNVLRNFYTIKSVVKVEGGGSLYWQELDGEYQISGGEVIYSA